MNAMENERKKKEHGAVVVVFFTQAVRPGFKFRLSLFFVVQSVFTITF